jgi:hypothetical protein
MLSPQTFLSKPTLNLLVFALLACFLLQDFPSKTLASSSPTCYGFQGQIDPAPRICPNSFMCCYLNRNDSYPDDECIQGTCLSHDGDQNGQYFVVACTDIRLQASGSCSAIWKECGMSHLLRVPTGRATIIVHSLGPESICCKPGDILTCDQAMMVITTHRRHAVKITHGAAMTGTQHVVICLKGFS